MKTISYFLSGLLIVLVLLINYPLLAADNDAVPIEGTKDVGILLLIGFALFLLLLLILWVVQLGRQIREESKAKKPGDQWLID